MTQEASKVRTTALVVLCLQIEASSGVRSCGTGSDVVIVTTNMTLIGQKGYIMGTLSCFFGDWLKAWAKTSFATHLLGQCHGRSLSSLRKSSKVSHGTCARGKCVCSPGTVRQDRCVAKSTELDTPPFLLPQLATIFGVYLSHRSPTLLPGETLHGTQKSR